MAVAPLLTVENESMLEGDFLLNLLVTALEGGSNHWYRFNFGLLKQQKIERFMVEKDLSTSEGIWAYLSDVETNHIKVFDFETGEKVGEFNRQKAIDALTLVQSEYPRIWKDLQEGSYDADSADVWFQLAVLDDVVYC